MVFEIVILRQLIHDSFMIQTIRETVRYNILLKVSSGLAASKSFVRYSRPIFLSARLIPVHFLPQSSRPPFGWRMEGAVNKIYCLRPSLCFSSSLHFDDTFSSLRFGCYGQGHVHLEISQHPYNNINIWLKINSKWYLIDQFTHISLNMRNI